MIPTSQARTTEEPLLDVEGLEIRFKVRTGYVQAVSNVSFQLKESETLAVVGESGCGKSVTMLSILRLLPPAARIVKGEALFRGRDLFQVDDCEMRAVRGAEIAMIFQDPMTSLNPVLTIGAQIAEALVHHGRVTKEQALHRSAELLDLVGIADATDRLREYPHQLSGGMRQRVMIAMALACQPAVLIADEPTTALDVTIQAQITELVKRLRDQLGMAIIWVTHDLSVVAGLADRVIVMYAGFVVEEAAVDDLYDDPRHPYTVGLLCALPSIIESGERRLTSIDGTPPELIARPECCPFHPRCDYAIDKCRLENPCLSPVAGMDDPQHRIACWIDIRDRSPR